PPARRVHLSMKLRIGRAKRGGGRMVRRGTRLAWAALVVLALAISAIGDTPALRAQPAPAQVSTSPASTFSGPAAQQQVDALAVQIGSPPAGSAAYDQAVQYALSELQQWGYQPVLQSFPVETYDDRGSQLEI